MLKPQYIPNTHDTGLPQYTKAEACRFSQGKLKEVLLSGRKSAGIGPHVREPVSLRAHPGLTAHD